MPGRCEVTFGDGSISFADIPDNMDKLMDGVVSKSEVDPKFDQHWKCPTNK